MATLLSFCQRLKRLEAICNSLCEFVLKGSEICFFVFREHQNITFLYSAMPNLTFILFYNLLIPILFLLQVTKEMCRKTKKKNSRCFCSIVFLSFFFIYFKELAKRQLTRSFICSFLFFFKCVHVKIVLKFLTVLTIPKTKVFKAN